MKKLFTYLASSAFLTLTLASAALAANPMANLNQATPDLIKGNADLPKLIGSAISILIGLVGVFFLAMIIYAGFMWGTAQGDPGKVKKAKDVMTNATIGLIITIGAYAITYYIFQGIGIK